MSAVERCGRCGRERVPGVFEEADWARDDVVGPVCPDCLTADERLLIDELRENRIREIEEFLGRQDPGA